MNMWQAVHGSFAKLIADVSSPAYLKSKLIMILAVILLFVAARVAIHILHRSIDKLFDHRAMRLDERRRRTLEALAANVVRYVIYFFVVVTLFEMFHFPTVTLLTGAGAAGLVVGLSAQNLIRDTLSGFFILFEDQFAVGDFVSIGATRGRVVEIGLRTTTLTAPTGEVHILQNGQITQVTNFSKGTPYAIVDFRVKYEFDFDRLMNELDIIATEAFEKVEGLIAKPYVLGIEDLAAADMLVRLCAPCTPEAQQDVSRFLRERVARLLSRELRNTTS